MRNHTAVDWGWPSAPTVVRIEVLGAWSRSAWLAGMPSLSVMISPAYLKWGIFPTSARLAWPWNFERTRPTTALR